MMSLIPPRGRGLVVICLLAGLGLGVSACGRRGYPEAPPDTPVQTRQRADARPANGSTAPFGEEDYEDQKNPEDALTDVSPQPTPTRRRGRNFVVPKEPFILDPLL